LGQEEINGAKMEESKCPWVSENDSIVEFG